MRSSSSIYAAFAELMSSMKSMPLMRSRHGGIPLASLPRKVFRQLTSHRSYYYRSKYEPHQGARECERRRRRMAKGIYGY